MPSGRKPNLANSSASGINGTRDESISMVTELAVAISRLWPIRENPVISVAAWTSRSLAASRPILLSLVMEARAALAASEEASPPLRAVFTTPTPMALVRTRASPTLAPLLDQTSFFFMNPVTQSPYLGVGSAIVWPPAITAPLSLTLSIPPRRIWSMTEMGRHEGKQRRFMATLGSPPMA